MIRVEGWAIPFIMHTPTPQLRGLEIQGEGVTQSVLSCFFRGGGISQPIDLPYHKGVKS